MRALSLLIGGIAVVCITACQRPVSYSEARTVIDRRCLECHSEKPTNRAFPFAPQGVKLDTAAEMQEHAPRIKASVAIERSMPLANLGGMTDDERRLLSRWVDAGAKLQ